MGDLEYRVKKLEQMVAVLWAERQKGKTNNGNINKESKGAEESS